MPERKAPGKSAAKSAEKSAAPGVPFQRGHDPRRGRGPRAGTPNAGRPRNDWREACRAALEKADGLGFIAQVMSGEAVQAVGVDKHGKPILRRPRIRDRLNAVKLLLDYAYGKPTQDVQPEDEQPRVTREELMAHLMEMLPHVVATLPVDPKELVRLLERRREIELLMQGGQGKDAGVSLS